MDAVAAGFVVAALIEAVVLRRETPGLLVFEVAGAPVLAVLAVRRRHPVLPVVVIAAFAALGTTAQSEVWPTANNNGGVWMLALLFAAYWLGAHAPARVAVLGGAAPLLVGLAVDLPTRSGWPLLNGIVFVAVFIGVLPTAVGQMVRIRRERLELLGRQRDELIREQQAQREAVVLAERLATTDRLQPALLEGLQQLADGADAGADPGRIEIAARSLLRRTREEVVALIAPVEATEPVAPVAAEHLGPLRVVAQPWSVLGGGAIGAGLALESTRTLDLGAPAWVAVLVSSVVGVLLAAMWWRPLPAVTLVWVTAAGFSRLVAPLDGTLSGTALALMAAFAVAALSSRRGAVAGLVLCWCGQLVGVGAGDWFGDAVIMLICWLGGLAVNEAGRLVEQGRENNRLLIGHEAVAKQRAVVEERLRLARELHDQLGHSLTVVALQAGAARRMATTDPARASEVMVTVATAARQGLHAIRGEGAADLDALIRRTRAAGLDLDVTGGGVIERLDAEERALVVRIVQEVLTNVLRHAPGAAASVRVSREVKGVTVVICNGPPSGSSGHAGSRLGLLGLQESVTAHGGDVQWGPRADGGFEVRAVLPLLERLHR